MRIATHRGVFALTLVVALTACETAAPVVVASPRPTIEGLPAAPTPTLALRPARSPSSAPSPSPSGLPATLIGAEWTRLPTTENLVALTFDAGGNGAGARAILDALAQADARATFFVTGRWVEVYPDLAREIASRHEIAHHTYSHPRLTQLSDDLARAEIERGASVIRAATGVDPRPLFRFPYGDRDARVQALVNRLGYGAIRWTVDTVGWMGTSGGQSVESVTARALGALSPGEIVLMHVGGALDRTTLDADALPALIAAIRARGYELVRVGDLLPH